MEFPVKTGAPATQKTACAILPVFAARGLKGATREIDRSCGGLLSQLVKSGDASAKLGETLLVPRLEGTAAGRALLLGCGKQADFDAKRFRQAVTAAVRKLRDTGLKEATSYLTYTRHRDLSPYYAGRISVEATHAALYQFEELKSQSAAKYKLAKLAIAIVDRQDAKEYRRGTNDGRAIAIGTKLARNLGDRPPNVCTPSHLAREARALGKRYANMEVTVLGRREMKRLGMGALLSVTQGAAEPPRFIIVRYRGAGGRVAPIVMCGKGVTFDTGGISLKPPPKMDEMKFDMCGAAGVLGTMAALGELQPNLNVIALVPACENMPGGRASRPGDIVKTLSGQTVEILNTDAEGRLILSDALTYAKRFKPRYLLDVATLTGACVVAVGHLYTGLFSNNDELANALLDAGKRSLDPAWRLPIDEEYGQSLKSNFADFANVGSRDAGASIAAQFLSRFVDDSLWAHLDIAGSAWLSNAGKGATGRPVALLTDFLLHL
ncbi:MAG: leucyl aminopeptidase [Gammaproteobacteria bacterium]|nr:MAG: leucyl aminopeptidase [Gammaproteobacteria bacterium]TDJ43509.1 MAG: leucyl aminopeptidase [Gammaproteobacteria bacterium]